MDMVAEVEVGDNVRWAPGEGAAGRVLRVWRETFPRGGEQQVAMVITPRGTFSMRAAHLSVVQAGGSPE